MANAALTKELLAYWAWAKADAFGMPQERPRRAGSFLKALSHAQMAKTAKHPGQRKTKKRRRANLAMAAFPEATP